MSTWTVRGLHIASFTIYKLEQTSRVLNRIHVADLRNLLHPRGILRKAAMRFALVSRTTSRPLCRSPIEPRLLNITTTKGNMKGHRVLDELLRVVGPADPLRRLAGQDQAQGRQ